MEVDTIIIGGGLIGSAAAKYLGQARETVAVLDVAIGNGWSAMCSDSIGRVAAHLMREGEFPEGFRSVDFEPVFAT